MASKKKAKKVLLEVGNYVRVGKGKNAPVGVVVGVEMNTNYDNDDYYEKNGEYEEVRSGEVYVASVDEDGNSDNDLRSESQLTKISAPQYAVVWSDAYSDPFCQFETRAQADAFVKKLRKNKEVVEVRIYKLTK